MEFVEEYYKKIDKSFFDGKVTIPNQYIECFVDFNEFDEHKSRDITVKFKSKKYYVKVSSDEAKFKLIKFLKDGTAPKQPIYTNLTDPVLSVQEGMELDAAYDFEDYRMKVNRYISENGNVSAIHKLTHNIPLTALDYEQLERVLTVELGSKADYEREFGETPFGLLIRRIAKLDHDAAMAAFSEFINDQSLNQQQIAFVHKVINHVEQTNGQQDLRVEEKALTGRTVYLYAAGSKGSGKPLTRFSLTHENGDISGHNGLAAGQAFLEAAAICKSLH